jgi:predicted  nucleic acid-binding Zn-ribbon protein
MVWMPTNKYESDITLKIEMAQLDLRRFETDLSRLEYELADVERQYGVLYDNYWNLKKKARVVSLSEYAAIKAELPRMAERRRSLNASVAAARQTVKSLKAHLEGLAGMLDKSRFRLLEFKKRERH